MGVVAYIIYPQYCICYVYTSAFGIVIRPKCDDLAGSYIGHAKGNRIALLKIIPVDNKSHHINHHSISTDIHTAFIQHSNREKKKLANISPSYVVAT